MQRRHLLQLLTALGAGVHHVAAHASHIVAVRIWPAPEYTRITLESDSPLQYSQLLLDNPPRLAVDIQGLTLTPTLRELVSKVQARDPNVEKIRVGQFTPDVVRIVIDLKQAIRPQTFTLTPVASYQHRLVFDLYPSNTAADPLEQLLVQLDKQTAQLEQAAAQQQSAQAARPSASAASVTASSPPLSEPMAARSPTANGGGLLPPTYSVIPESADDPLTILLSRQGGQVAAIPAPARPAQPSVLIPSIPPAVSQPPAEPARSRTPAIAATPPAQPPAVRSGGKTRPLLIAIDPGHGGEDPGASGPSGVREKDVVLRIAKLLRSRIERSTMYGRPMRTFMTRDSDYFVALGARVQRARRARADLFISIHADGFYKPEANGSSVYAFGKKDVSSAAARWLANKENASDDIGGVSLGTHDREVQEVLLDMSIAAQIRDSLSLGTALLGEIGKINRLHKAHVERANFAVLRAPDIPSVLVETAFVTNPAEEARLNSPAFQARIADAMMAGILKYLKHSAHRHNV